MRNGFDGIPLAVFTGIAPAGAVAIIVIAAMLLLHRFDDERHLRVSHLMAVPLAVTWLGFIASATHLGTPANALYAFSNVGSSPLSNEVTAAVAFLFFAGVYWLVSFMPNLPPALDKAGCIACIASGALLIGLTSVVYDVPTVVSWVAPYAPAALIAAAFCGGMSLVLLVASIAEAATKRTKLAFAIAATAGCIACAIILVGYVGFLGGTGNNVVAPGSLPTSYPIAIVLYAGLTALGLAVQIATVCLPAYGVRRAVLCGAGCAIVLVASVVVRVPFYEAYLSVGF